ncbi:MAG TPA: ribose-phosphate pyrophosphokinase [Gemmataceae bacterium]
MGPTSSPPRLKLIAGNAHPALAAGVARELGVAVEPAEVGAFADGETRVQIQAAVRGETVVIVQPTATPVNENLMVLALLADAARAAGAARVVAAVPYFGYARQERRGRDGDPRSAQVAARLLAAAGVDHLLTLDLHAPALESAFPMPATLLGAEEVFLPRVREWGLKDLVVVSPDAGGLKRAQRYASALAAGLAVIAKERPGPDQAEQRAVLGDVKGRPCLVVDDMASTGRTLAGAAEALRRAGAGEARALFTHAVMAPGAAERIAAAGFARVVTTDTVPAEISAGVEVLSAAPLLARAVASVCGGGQGEIGV